jgi:IS5 family transposase
MQPSKTERSPQEELFRSRLDQLLNRGHALFVLAQAIDWSVFEKTFGSQYVQDVGRPGLPIRLLVGLHYLKHLYNASDEAVVDQFLENPYWQYFCGCEYFQHHFPLDRSSLTRWRKRVGPQGIEKLLQETLATARRTKALKDTDLKRVVVDTTVQEKAVAFPTDARLYHKARLALVKAAKKRGLELRQTYVRLSKRTLFRQSRYAHAQQMKRARRETKRLRTFLGRVIRDVRRKMSKPDHRLKTLLARAERLYTQKREDTNKLYSLHAPEVECIAKGKAHKRYEFGCKVALVTTARSNWITAIDALHGNPYDGKTLKPSLVQMKRLTGSKPEVAFCDRGYRGEDHHPKGVAVHIQGKKRLSTTLRKWLKRRAAIEPVIGHLKSDRGLERNHLLGKQGDRMNAMLAGCAWNLKKILIFFLPVIFWLRRAIQINSLATAPV